MKLELTVFLPFKLQIGQIKNQLGQTEQGHLSINH